MRYSHRTVVGTLTIANEKRFKKGPSTKASGCTHGSVSESTIEDDTNPITSLDCTLREETASNGALFIVKSNTSNGDVERRTLLVNEVREAGAKPWQVAKAAMKKRVVLVMLLFVEWMAE